MNKTESLSITGCKIIGHYPDTSLGFYENFPKLSFNDLEIILTELKLNLSKVLPSEYWKNLIIELWDMDLPEAQALAKYIDANGIPQTASGFTRSGNVIQIFLKEFLWDKLTHYGNVISHEIGHWVAGNIGFDDTVSPIRKLWDKFRGIYSVKSTPPGELIAEDIRLLFGSEKTKGVPRGDYVQADKVPGLKTFYELYFSAVKYNFQEKSKLRTLKDFEVDVYSTSSGYTCHIRFFNKSDYDWLAWFSPSFKSYWEYIKLEKDRPELWRHDGREWVFNRKL